MGRFRRIPIVTLGLTLLAATLAVAGQSHALTSARLTPGGFLFGMVRPGVYASQRAIRLTASRISSAERA